MKLIFLTLLGCLNYAIAAQVSLEIQFEGESDSSSCGQQKTITAPTEEELWEKVQQALESSLSENPDITDAVSSQCYTDKDIHTSHIVNFETTISSNDAGDTSPTSSPMPITHNAIDHTASTVDLTNTAVSELEPIPEAEAPKASSQPGPNTDENDVDHSGSPEDSPNESTSASVTGSHVTPSTIEPELPPKYPMSVNCFEFNSKSFRALVTRALNVQFNDSLRICENIGWQIGNIYNTTHYEMLQDCLRPIVPLGRQWLHLWTGMVYKNGQLLTSENENVTFSKKAWHPASPYPQASYKNIAMEVNKNPKANNTGIINIPPYFFYQGVICETPLHNEYGMSGELSAEHSPENF